MKAFYDQPDGKDNCEYPNPNCAALPCASDCKDAFYSGNQYTCVHSTCYANHYHTTPLCHNIIFAPGGGLSLSGIVVESGMELVLRAPSVDPNQNKAELYLDYFDDSPNPNVRIASGAGITGEIINIDNGQPEWRFIATDVQHPGSSPSSMKLRSEGAPGNRYLQIENGWVVAGRNPDNAAVFDIQVVSDIGIQLQVNGNAVYAVPSADGSSYYLRADGASSDAVTFWVIVVGLPTRP